MVIKICAAHSGLQERRPDPKRSRAVTTETNTSSFAAIVVAAGKGLRVGGDLPKQFHNWRGRPMIRHSVEALITAGCEKLVLVVPDGMQERALKAVGLDQDIRVNAPAICSCWS
jgi:hypothetical protein